ncbi:MAG: UDP-N-acetylglucosamine--N-acetylmuramyl-(pentapeptide) pyrophosphoryl-undecaprenol N-acetylglucosamine transferase [Patescibacteria group bacterium]|nr:UDP-N-acetylglucosamine--N-acetylmuramyl-(pentapeptide) pyrophosphoryl-undecaprenol N-acetylglucosamine transferase [Patescibacteria group bacterium]
MKILLVGGGSGGPVAPLLAVAAAIKRHHSRAEFLLLGTKFGPERQMAAAAEIEFMEIPAGKWRRYFSLKNLTTPFEVLAGFFAARKIIKRFEPDCVFGAGGFAQVPVVWAAKFAKIPSVIHQQDLQASLANRLCQSAATLITVSFADSQAEFSSGSGLFYKKNKSKVVLAGNPFRESLASANKQDGVRLFDLKEDLPTLLVLGGGTGSQYLNSLITSNLKVLTKYVQIIHATGANKGSVTSQDNYYSADFIDNMGAAYAAADVVLCRAGLSTITELSNLGKVAIVVPLLGTHQEFNAYFLFRSQAAIVFDQSELSGPILVKTLRRLLFERELQENLKRNISKIMPKNSTQKIADLIIKLSETTQ